MKHFGDLCYLLGKLRGVERVLEDAVANAKTEHVTFASRIELIHDAVELLNKDIGDSVVEQLKEKGGQ